MKAPTKLEAAIEMSTTWDAVGLTFVATRRGSICSLSITTGSTSRTIASSGSEVITTIPEGYRPAARLITQDNGIGSADKIPIAINASGEIQVQKKVASGQYLRIYVMYYV